jgi:ComF family protein
LRHRPDRGIGMLSKWLRSVLPGSCVLCAAVANEQGLCDGCLASLPAATGSRCPVCATPTPNASLCGRCISRPPRYDHVVSALDYATPADYLVAQLKYSRNMAAARALASTLASRLDSEPCPDIVMPMPIADSRLRERGFNQATEIARHACSPFGLRISHGIAQRISAGVSQTALPWSDRARNVRGVFRCQADLSGKTVAVVDDVITTGATLNELATVLKRAGAARVVGWIVARTPPRS